MLTTIILAIRNRPRSYLALRFLTIFILLSAIYLFFVFDFLPEYLSFAILGAVLMTFGGFLLTAKASTEDV